MKKLAVFAVLLSFLAGCKKKETSDLDILRAHTWQFTDYRTNDGTILLTEPSADSVTRHMIIQFVTGDSIIGHDCANDYSGRYLIDEARKVILIKRGPQTAVASALAYCQNFIPALAEAESYSVTDQELFLNYFGGSRSIHFIKAD